MEQSMQTKYEECSRCGQYNQLIWTGKIWLQPEHGCDGELLFKHFFSLAVDDCLVCNK